MTKEEIRERLQAKSDITRQELYDIMDALGLTYRKTNCKKCLADYRAMVMEEVGLIKSAADNSGWDEEAEYEYLKGEDYSWQGHRLNQDTPKWVIRRFFASAPAKAGQYYRAVQNKNTIDDKQDETESSEIFTQD